MIVLIFILSSVLSKDGGTLQIGCPEIRNYMPDFFKNCQKVEFCIIFTENMDYGVSYTLSLAQFRQLFPFPDRVSMGDDLCLVHAGYDESLSVLRHPCRFDGFLAFFCISGRMKIMINLTEFEVTENSLFVYIPGNIVSVPELDESVKDELSVIVIAMTSEYMAGLRTDVPKLIGKGMSLIDRPFLYIRDSEKKLAGRYMSLIADVLESNLMYKRESVSALLSSVFFLAGGIAEQQLSESGMKNGAGYGRSHIVFEKFLALVSEYHTSRRTVSFYAEKLCLTPKYLAKLVRTATGRSASEWIDGYVILEAKNMLRYSSLPVKEIASRLNFSDVPSFHRFFRSRTGLTPLEYRKS